MQRLDFATWENLAGRKHATKQSRKSSQAGATSSYATLSDQPKLHLSFLGDHRLVPRRFPNKVHLGGGDAGRKHELAPGAVSVMEIFTWWPSPILSMSIEYTRPRSTIFTGISGSKTCRSWCHIASG